MIERVNIFNDIQQYLAQDIADVNQLILSNIVDSDSQLIQTIAKYLVDSGGKRIRPLITLLSSKMFIDEDKNTSSKAESSRKSIFLAAAIELIHTATLLHDDVVDESKSRRFNPTANVLWGNKASILVGDFLFSKAFQLMTKTQCIESLEALSLASTIIAQGEVSQLVTLNERKMISVEEYNAIVLSKTASLFGVACEVGGILSNQNSTYRECIKNFGINLGHMFQISDDWLDYAIDGNDTGKTTGNDFREGKVTLPLILLYDTINADEKEEILQTIRLQNRSNVDSNADLAKIKLAFKMHQIESKIHTYLNSLKQNALIQIDSINIKNVYYDYLIQILDFVMHRSF